MLLYSIRLGVLMWTLRVEIITFYCIVDILECQMLSTETSFLEKERNVDELFKLNYIKYVCNNHILQRLCRNF